MRHYCTLFDYKYMAQGLSLYSSLLHKSSEPFTLWIMPMCEKSRKYLQYINLPFVALLDEMYFPPTAEVHWQRPISYRCFGMASEVINTVMKEVQDTVTYCDADTYAFYDPKLYFDEMGDKLVGIVPHRFPPYDVNRLSPNGWFNVSWVTFTNNLYALTILQWWIKQCRIKCDAESIGDQKYLDYFPKLNPNLHEFKSIGIGAGPWNAYTYNITNGPKVNNEPLVFYHFHEFRQLGNKQYHLTGYKVTDAQKEHIYNPYINSVEYMQSHIDIKEKEGFFKC